MTNKRIEYLSMLQKLSVFANTFNKRPDRPDVYYSEKLLTKNQIKDYEKALNYFQEKIGVFSSIEVEPEKFPASKPR